jgi:hypothetical protein
VPLADGGQSSGAVEEQEPSQRSLPEELAGRFWVYAGSVAVSLAAACLLRFALGHRFDLHDARVLSRVARRAPPLLDAAVSPWLVLAVGILGMIIQRVPARWVGRAQTLSVALLAAGFPLLRYSAGAALGLLGFYVIAAIALTLVPLERTGWRKGAIIVATAMLPALTFVPWESGRLVLISHVCTFVAACHAIGASGRRRSIANGTRAIGVDFFPFSATAPDDVFLIDRRENVAIKGAAWVVLGGIFLAAIPVLPFKTPFAGFDLYRPWEAVGRALACWAFVMVYISGVLFYKAGLLRLLGIPIQSPVGNLLKASNFMEYWRVANVFQYKLMRDVYFQTFFPRFGNGMYVGIFGTLLLSAVLHSASDTRHGYSLLRWSLEGLLVAATAYYLQRRMRSQIGRFVAKRGVGKKPSQSFPLKVLCIFVVVTAHGFLMALERL